MIMYREQRDGGIQGILLDFYVDEYGRIANEFFRIDESGELIKVSQGIKPLMDKGQVEKVFK